MSLNIRCLIIDDEPLALELIESYVLKTPFLELVGKSASAFQAMQLMDETKVDLLFLDIQMPGLTGLEFSKSLQSDVRVIFTTAFSQFALEGFKVDALDYLVKPFNYSEFLGSAQKAHKWFSMVNAPRSGTLEQDARSIMVKSESRMIGIDMDSILFMESMGDYIKIYCIDNPNPVITQNTMKSMDEKLPTHIFFRVHRSYIVNMDHVKTIERNRIIFDKTHIPISESIKEAFNKKLNERYLM